MKILYAIQGTGNGHISRAREILPLLMKEYEVDILISGIQSDIELPWPVAFRLYGLSFIFGKKGGVDVWETYKKSNLRNLYKEVMQLDVDQYDLVLNDFEPVSAWACYFKNKPCISLSHQAAVVNKKSPRPLKFDPVGKAVLKRYAPTSDQYGFHFERYDKNIFTPVIRSEIRALPLKDDQHFTVYLPAYSNDRIIKVLKECDDVRWEVFSKHCDAEVEVENIIIKPIQNDAFIQSMANSSGVLCGAGFETPAEAMYMKKKLMVIPMKGQFEQQCNAEALKKLGVPVLKSLKKKHLVSIRSWILSEEKPDVQYEDQTAAIVQMILKKHAHSGLKGRPKSIESLADFKNISIRGVLKQLENK